MSLTNSRLAYRDCYELMDEALKHEQGARASMGSEGSAMGYRIRMNKARQLDREFNKKVYQDPGHALHGGSIYDELIFTVREDETGNWWVYLRKTIRPSVVEPIEESA
jgi:hypothetical protein